MDDDGIVEDVIEDGGDMMGGLAKPNFLVTSFNLALSTIESYGWFLLIGCLVGYFAYQHFKNKLKTMADNRPVKVDENEALTRMERIEAARQRQQAAYDAAKAKYLEEKKIKDEQLAIERAKEWELHKQGLGYKNKSKSATEDKEEELAKLGLSANNALKKKPKLRESDFNPLTGTSSNESSCSFRPSRPGPRGGG